MKEHKASQYSNNFYLGKSFNKIMKFVFVTAMITSLVISTFVAPFFNAEAAGVANSIIVTLNDDPAAVWKAKTEKQGGSVSAEDLQNYRNGLKIKQNQFLSDLEARGISYEIDGVDVKNLDGSNAGHVEFRNTLVLNAITVKVPASAINAVRAMPQVKRVEPNGQQRILLSQSVDYVNAPAAYGQVEELTAFDNHREGFEGQGINIAVLDTGIDWSHPMFGGDPTPPRHGLAPNVAAINSNQKVIYYLPFTGTVDDYGHGTHASADAAGYLGFAPGADSIPNTADDLRLHGVAPQARLMGYKVCAANGSCVTAATNLAIEDAVSPLSLTLQPKPVAHVINLSLGGSGGPDDSSAVAASNAALLGTIVVASAGNEGPGDGTVGSPAAGRHVIAVGANNDPAIGANIADLIGGRSGMIANKLEGSAAINADLVNQYVNCGLAETPDAMPNSVAGKIALIQRGSTVNVDNPALPTGAGTGLFATKAAWALAKGAVAVVFYNNEDSELSSAAVRASTVPVVGISKANGEYLISQMGPNQSVGAVSTKMLRLNKNLTFTPQMADFSSRGPVQGLGQVKPDVTAPGVGVLAATSLVGVPANSMMDPSRYIAANGTSFSGPHVAGATAIVKQAHLNWSPDMVRAALINTATNLRTSNGAAKPDNSADSIIEQGGGLINVKAAVDAKALMGVVGDGIETPGILASHSFGETAILNNRILNTREVTVTIKDVSGQGGTYNLSTVNNRLTDLNGVTTSVSPSSVNVPAGGSVTFTARIAIDGDVVRDTAEKQFQWYVAASRSGSTEKLRMPLYLKATRSLPSDDIAGSETETYTGTVLASDAGAQRDQGIYLANSVTYTDVPFQVGAGTLKIDATLSFDDTTGAGIPDIDFLLFDPNGNELGRSSLSGGPERITASTTVPGTYIYRAYGWANGPTEFQIESKQLFGGSAPVVQAFASDFTSGIQRFDFDGNYTLNWQPRGSVLNYEVEESTDGNNWSVVRTVDGNTTSVSFTNPADGTRSYRVRSITPGRIGKYVTLPSNVESITISRRIETDVTSSVTAINRSITFPAGATELVTALKNQSSTVFFPNIRFEIISVESSGNSVTVANADSGGNGVTTPAVFDYSQLVGADFVPNEESGNKTIRFNNPNTVLFQFTAKVKAHVPTGSSSGGASSSSSSAGGSSSSGSGGSTGGGVNSQTGGLLNTTRLLRFTVNPLTQTVTIQVLQ